MIVKTLFKLVIFILYKLYLNKADSGKNFFASDLGKIREWVQINFNLYLL